MFAFFNCCSPAGTQETLCGDAEFQSSSMAIETFSLPKLKEPEERPRQAVAEGFYTGQWIGKNMHGKGKMELTDGSSVEGTWIDGELTTGRQVLDGKVYEGQFLRGKRHGHGTCQFEDGRHYIGTWTNGRMDGEGRMTWPDGMFYEGQYVDDKKSGVGQFTWADGRMYSGEWSKGKQHGTGTYMDSKGHSWTGTWESGKKCVEKAASNDKELPRPSRLSLSTQSTASGGST